LTSENEVYGFGAGNYGECGNGEFLDTSKPKLVKFPSKEVNDTKSFVQNETCNFGNLRKS
jgi:alpha-tubulin suppressor-like RCC1 family protein